MLQLYRNSLLVAAPHFNHGVGFRPIYSKTASDVRLLLRDLRQLDTSSLCDADKTIGSGVKLMNNTIRPMNHVNRGDATHGADGSVHAGSVMAGVARTVAFTEPNDFLPVMRALALEAEADEVLVVDTLSSTRAVAGEIFASEARRKGVAGIVIDGPIRDAAHLDQGPTLGTARAAAHEREEREELPPTMLRLYATGVTPYSGTTQSPGEMQAAVVTCGGIEVRPGDIVVGDQDGVLVGEAAVFAKLVPIAKEIQRIESKLIRGIALSSSAEKCTLASMTNLDEHVRRRLEGKASNLEFRM